MSRIVECEKENTDLRMNANSKLEQEKKELLKEVEEIRAREEKLEQEI